jgi:hypothetical protein
VAENITDAHAARAREHQRASASRRPRLPCGAGLDQTRGWFYTLMVLSTALFGKPAFRNLVCNGLVLAADGKKMSKRLRNYPVRPPAPQAPNKRQLWERRTSDACATSPCIRHWLRARVGGGGARPRCDAAAAQDPTEILDEYGADALRLYLINSPVVRAETLKFRKEGVFSVIKDVMLPWYNAYRFLVQNALRWEAEAGACFDPLQARERASGGAASLSAWAGWRNACCRSTCWLVSRQYVARIIHHIRHCICRPAVHIMHAPHDEACLGTRPRGRCACRWTCRGPPTCWTAGSAPPRAR